MIAQNKSKTPKTDWHGLASIMHRQVSQKTRILTSARLPCSWKKYFFLLTGSFFSFFSFSTVPSGFATCLHSFHSLPLLFCHRSQKLVLAAAADRGFTNWGRNSFRCCTEAWPGRYWAEYWRTRPAPPFVPSSSSSLLPLPSSSSSSSSLHALNCCSEKFAQYYWINE